jgi:Fe-S-cluster containining protein
MASAGKTRRQSYIDVSEQAREASGSSGFRHAAIAAARAPYPLAGRAHTIGSSSTPRLTWDAFMPETEPRSAGAADDGRTGAAPAAGSAVAVARLDITVAGQKMHIEVPIPTAPVAGAALVPIARALAEAIAGRVVEVEAAAGRAVSCRKGCAACCRHIAPLSAIEARALHALVEAMPEPRRSVVRARFAALRAALAAVGLLEPVLDLAALPRDQAIETGARYTQLALACPFLEADETCGIHAERPLVCREYLVTSPAAYCFDPAAGRIEGVPRPLRFNEALIVSDPESSDGGTWVALPAALDWVARHPEPPPPIPGPDLLRRFLGAVLERDLPGPPLPTPGAQDAAG